MTQLPSEHVASVEAVEDSRTSTHVYIKAFYKGSKLLAYSQMIHLADFDRKKHLGTFPWGGKAIEA